MDARAIRACIAACVSAILVAGIEIDKHHYAAHRLSARIIGGVLAWLALAAIALAMLEAVAWLGRRLRPGDHGVLPGGLIAWGIALLAGAAWLVLRVTERADITWTTERVAARVVAWFVIALVVRVVLLLAEAAWLRVRRS